MAPSATYMSPSNFVKADKEVLREKQQQIPRTPQSYSTAGGPDNIPFSAIQDNASALSQFKNVIDNGRLRETFGNPNN